MKKLLILVVILLLVIPVAAWAEKLEGSYFFSRCQENKIVEAIQVGFGDEGVDSIIMVHRPDCSLVECGLAISVDVIFFIYPDSRVAVEGRGDEAFQKKLVKKAVLVKKKIEAVLNPSAREKLGNILD